MWRINHTVPVAELAFICILFGLPLSILPMPCIATHIVDFTWDTSQVDIPSNPSARWWHFFKSLSLNDTSNLVSLITHIVAHTLLFNSLTVRLDTCLNPNAHLVSHASTKVSFDRLFNVGFLVSLIIQWLPELSLLIGLCTVLFSLDPAGLPWDL